MPNWTENSVEISVKDEYSNDKKKILKEIKDFLKGNEGKFDFNKIIPMPKELKDAIKGGCTINGKKCSLWWKKDGIEIPVPQKLRNEWIEKYGADNWYDWAYKHWGTKWNACNIWEIETEKYKETKPIDKGYFMVYKFNTAWSPPYLIAKKLKKLSNDENSVWYKVYISWNSRAEDCGEWIL